MDFSGETYCQFLATPKLISVRSTCIVYRLWQFWSNDVSSDAFQWLPRDQNIRWTVPRPDRKAWRTLPNPTLNLVQTWTFRRWFPISADERQGNSRGSVDRQTCMTTNILILNRNMSAGSILWTNWQLTICVRSLVLTV